MNRTVTYMAGMILVLMTGYILIVGRGIILPIVVAVFIWYLINTFKYAVQRLPYIGEKLPYSFSLIISLIIMSTLVALLINIITSNVNDVIEASPRYQENFMRITEKIDDYFHINILKYTSDFAKGSNLQGIIVNISGVFTSLMSSAVLILLYVVFLFIEQHFFRQKMTALFRHHPENKLIAANILHHIVRDTQTYIGLKTLMGFIISLSSWIIMKLVGLDFAEFWAMLIFFLSYIPNIGAIIATVFPAMLALVQFESWLPFVIISCGLSAVQFLIGNIIEPKFFGDSLNVSTLVILFSLALWGAMWGILGMLLAVPITAIMMIIFAHFDATRPIAVLLSQDGKINRAYETL